ncbi:MAG TPA: phage terminase large subunit family protein [Spirochaetota bacterium]|nr:phage terminase large subunit family protein [Spirochaetota bacterium]
MNDDFIEFVGKLGNDKFKELTFLEWCEKHIRLVRNGALLPYSIEGHDYLKEIFELPDVPRETHQKAAQMTISTTTLLRQLRRMDRYALKVGYYFPTDEDVADFAQDRANPIIDNSDYLSGKMRYDKADNLGLKQMGNSSLYFRGVWTKRKVKSVDLDAIVKDEVDEADQENLVFAEDRLLHSSFGWITELSQPSKPDFGINRTYKKSDMRMWFVKCPKCGRWNNLVESFPKNLFHKGKGNNLTAWIGCTRCHAKLTTSKGEWVASHPSRSKDHVGFLESQLFGSEITATDIYTKFIEATLLSEKKRFWISIIGVPYYDPEMQPISDELLESCEVKEYGFERSAQSAFIGIDVGDVCHATVWGWTGYRLRLLWCEEILSDDFDGFCRLIERYRAYFVIDAMPYKNLSKRLCLKYFGWGSIQYFKGEALTEKKEGEGEYEVPVVMHNRTESIDEMVDLFREGFFVLPNPKKLAPDELERYERWKSQMKALEKDKTVDKSGYEKSEYKKNVANHYGMSTNSGLIAFRVGRGSFTPPVNPVVG